jgi:hypothetical protein
MQQSLQGCPSANLVSPIHSSMKILRVKDSQVLCRPTMVTVDTLTGDGLGFRSPLLFPVDEHVILGFDFQIYQESIHLEGYITRRSEESDVHFYQVALVEKISGNAEWVPLLNRFLSMHKPIFIKLDKSYGGFTEWAKIKKNIQQFI